MFKYPYGDSQQLNLDWIIQKIKELEAGGGGGSSDLTLEEVANALISLTYNSGTAYQRYDYCYLQGKLYRALANTSGPFDPASWMEVRIGDDIPVLTRLLNAVDTSLNTLQNTVGDLVDNVDNLDSDDIENASSQVSGTTVTDALDNLKGAINSLETANGYDIKQAGTYNTGILLLAAYITGSGNYCDFFVPLRIASSRTIASCTLDLSSTTAYTKDGVVNNAIDSNTVTVLNRGIIGFRCEAHFGTTQTPNTNCTLLLAGLTIVIT